MRVLPDQGTEALVQVRNVGPDPHHVFGLVKLPSHSSKTARTSSPTGHSTASGRPSRRAGASSRLRTKTRGKCFRKNQWTRRCSISGGRSPRPGDSFDAWTLWSRTSRGSSCLVSPPVFTRNLEDEQPKWGELRLKKSRILSRIWPRCFTPSRMMRPPSEWPTNANSVFSLC